MKKLLIILFILLFFSISFSLPRPTNEWLVIYDNNQTLIVEADSHDEAIKKFRREVKRAEIFSVSKRSYVQSIWIWID